MHVWAPGQAWSQESLDQTKACLYSFQCILCIFHSNGYYFQQFIVFEFLLLKNNHVLTTHDICLTRVKGSWPSMVSSELLFQLKSIHPLWKTLPLISYTGGVNFRWNHPCGLPYLKITLLAYER